MPEAPTPPTNYTTPLQVSTPGTPPTPGAAVASDAIASLSVPTIGTLTPSTIAAGAANALVTVAGTKFEPGCTIYWGATPLPTNYVSPTSCTAIFPHSTKVGAGAVAIKVQNVNPLAVTSTTNFTYS